jgi:threonine synthase
MFAAEPAVRAPLSKALADGLDAAQVPARPTSALSIGTTVSGYRGVLTVRKSGGASIPVTEDHMREAQTALARSGLWQELSGAAGVGALKSLGSSHFDGPVVCILTSSGFKDGGSGGALPDELPPTWTGIEGQLRTDGIL